MIVVLDTSAGVEIALWRANAELFSQLIEDADWVVAPTLYVAEATNTFWKYHQFSDLERSACEKGVDDALRLVDDFIDMRPMTAEAFSLACLTQKSVYDMFYLVLARRHDAFLLTLDSQLRKTAVKQSIRVAEIDGDGENAV